jgi:phytoene dehydrogenase-like protein
MSVDVVVIGAGLNGLTAAATLAKSGRSVVVLERGAVVGGLAAEREIHPGFRVPGLLSDTSTVSEAVVDELNLTRHGFAWREAPDVAVPSAAGSGFRISADPKRTADALRAVSATDAARYPQFVVASARLGSFVREAMTNELPALDARGLRGRLPLAKRMLSFRRLGSRDMMELLRIGPMCVADWLNEWFETESLKAAIAAPSLLGTFMGPWSPGSVANLLRHQALSGARSVRGGPAAAASALAATATAHGAAIRTNAPVEGIRVEGGVVRGVSLRRGETIDASVVLATCDPKTALLGLVRPLDLPPKLEGRIRHYRCEGNVVVVDLAIRGSFGVPSVPGPSPERLRVGATLDDLERAFDAIKYGRASDTPILDVWVPSIADPSLAPEGHHVVSILAQFAPWGLRGGWTDEARQTVLSRVVETLATHVPALRESIVASSVAAPPDLEQRLGLAGGHVYHGDHAIDQFLARPAPECSRHDTPIPGLYLGGSGTHPGGGLTCLPGWLAARRILGR